MAWPDVSGRRVGIWGLGREGRAALRWLESRSPAQVVLVDDDPAAAADLGLPVLGGDAGTVALSATDLVIKSAGISRYDPRAEAIRAAGVPVTTGAALWMSCHAPRTVGVTGSKGKSTTSSLVHHILAHLGVRAVLAGNIGIPLLDLDTDGVERFVVELSSYQCAELTESPEVAVVTALFPEHVNWHGSVEQYYNDKLNIVSHGPWAVVYNALDETLRAVLAARTVDAEVIAVGRPDGPHVSDGEYRFGAERLFGTEVCSLRGRHNQVNVCLAIGAVAATGVDCVAARAEIAAALESFAALPHRLATIEDAAAGITFVDDSLSTAPQATIAALEAFSTDPVCVIVGGEDRGLDYAPLRDYLLSARRSVTLIGVPVSGDRILATVADVPGVSTRSVDGVRAAVAACREVLSSGGLALLSPGAPSYSQFRNYEDRSAEFRAAITDTAPGTK
jgi:UDP-N-acetylmuramoylalanine--D-glutamate ligase